MCVWESIKRTENSLSHMFCCVHFYLSLVEICYFSSTILKLEQIHWTTTTCESLVLHCVNISCASFRPLWFHLCSSVNLSNHNGYGPFEQLTPNSEKKNHNNFSIDLLYRGRYCFSTNLSHSSHYWSQFRVYIVRRIQSVFSMEGWPLRLWENETLYRQSFFASPAVSV